ncbi:MAG: lipid A export permease/ATP-binding protein MsbA [Gammaproteobacteria bacterium]|nr:MAG: lipid A export permease/ATP-binding protein MsbA [Gammaproteobacteria bacterium]
MNSKQLYLRLLKHVRPYWRTFALAIFSMVLVAATEPAIPALLKPVLDGSFVERDLSSVNLLAGILVAIFFVRGAASFISALAMAWVAGKLVMDLRRMIFEKLLRLPTPYYDKSASGTLISKVTFDVSQVTEAATYVLTVLVRDSLAIFGLVAWMLYLEWRLTMVALVTAPFVVFIVKRLSKRLRRMSVGLQGAMGDVTHVLQETIDGQKVVRVFGGQEYETNRFHSAINWARRYQMKFAVAANASSPIAQLLTAIALAAIVFIAAHQSAAGEITIGGFVSFFAAMVLLFSPLKRLTSINGPLQRGLAAAESVFALVDEKGEQDTGTRALGRATGRVEFRDLGFRYGEEQDPAIDNLSLVIEPGMTVALVGPSGGGKTTLVNLIPRFYNPTSGSISIDGVDTQELSLSSLRDNVALVSQDIVLFNDTIAANIAYGPLQGSARDDVVAAAQAAHAMEFIEQLPRGLDTNIGEDGVRLSGGQRQRIAITRAFLKDAPILILDEATSSLDSESELQIQAALEKLREGRTTIVIAHRLSTIQRADQIVVLADGRIAEFGTHATLLERNNLYAGLYRFQFARQQSDTPVAGAS